MVDWLVVLWGMGRRWLPRERGWVEGRGVILYSWFLLLLHEEESVFAYCWDFVNYYFCYFCL